MARLAALIAMALLLVACGSEKKQAGGTPTTSTLSNRCKVASDASTAARTSPALQNRETMYLTGVTTETNDCRDRVVFSFRKGMPGPGYEVRYEPAESAKLEDGSGTAIAIEGSAFLVVRLSPAATAVTNGDKLELTYTGPKHVKPAGTRHVVEIAKTGDFEAVVTWVIGLDEERPFTATASESQLVVDIS